MPASDLVKVSRALRIKKRVGQGCMLFDGQLWVAGEAPEPGQDAHNIGIHHCHMLPAGNGRYGVACVGANACSSRGAACVHAPEERTDASNVEALAEVMRTHPCRHERSVGKRHGPPARAYKSALHGIVVKSCQRNHLGSFAVPWMSLGRSRRGAAPRTAPPLAGSVLFDSTPSRPTSS